MAKKTFYVTTPIYYPNDVPHLGHAYTTIATDVLSRWHSLLGKEVFFLTGTDEHGKKLEAAANNAGKTPKEFVDSMIPEFKKAWEKLNIKYDRFIRTTDKDHEEVVQNILTTLNKKGDIYKGFYEGLYCTACEAYYTEKDCPDGLCPIHKKPVELLKEESYFFKLSKYQKPLLDLYKKNPDFISPSSKKQEVINRVKEGLQDLSISRTSFSWGIPFPFDKKHITFVWVDALTNYISGIGYLKNKKTFKKFWPADVHIIGKDIIWFHTVYWPAILLALGIEPPKKVFAHGWWTVRNEKMGKSAGNAIKIDQLIGYAGVDSVRYFLLRETPFGEDGDFSEQALIDRHNNELADKLGNLVSRVSTLAEKFGLEKTSKNPLKSKDLQKKVEKHFEKLEFDKALNEIFAFIDKCNAYVQETKPWESGDKEVLYNVVCAIKDVSILLSPFIPETAEKIAKIFNFEINYKQIGKPIKIAKIKKSEILFKKIDTMAKQASTKKSDTKNVSAKTQSIKSLPVTNMSSKAPVQPTKSLSANNVSSKSPANTPQESLPGIVQFSDWERLDLRVAKVKNVEDIEGADKLYKLTLDVGDLGERIVCAGLKQHYKKEELKGKKLIYFSNLSPRQMRGIESQGMILAAVSKDHSKVILIAPEKDIDVGSRIS